MPFTKIKAQNLYSSLLSSALCLMPVLGLLAPRALGILPAILGVLFFFLHRFTYQTWPRPNKFFLVLCGVILSLAASSLLWAVDPDIAQGRLEKLLLILTGGGLLLMSLDQASTKYFIRYMPWALVVTGVFCVFEMYTGGVIYMRSHPDATGFNPSDLNRAMCFYVLCFWPALHLLRLWSEKPRKALTAILGLLMAAILFKTDSQSAQLAFILSAPIYFAFPAGRNWAWGVFGFVLIAGFWAAPWIAQAMFDRFAEATTEIGWLRRSFAAHRMEIWNFVSDRALQRPIYGHGIEATRAIKDFDTEQRYHEISTALHPHNFALQIWIEFGALGVAAFSAVISWALVKLSKLPTMDARLLMACLVASLSVSATGYGLWQSWWIGGLCVCASLCVWSITAQKQENTI